MASLSSQKSAVPPTGAAPELVAREPSPKAASLVARQPSPKSASTAAKIIPVATLIPLAKPVSLATASDLPPLAETLKSAIPLATTVSSSKKSSEPRLTTPPPSPARSVSSVETESDEDERDDKTPPSTPTSSSTPAASDAKAPPLDNDAFVVVTGEVTREGDTIQIPTPSWKKTAFVITSALLAAAGVVVGSIKAFEALGFDLHLSAILGPAAVVALFFTGVLIYITPWTELANSLKDLANYVKNFFASRKVETIATPKTAPTSGSAASSPADATAAVVEQVALNTKAIKDLEGQTQKVVNQARAAGHHLRTNGSNALEALGNLNKVIIELGGVLAKTSLLIGYSAALKIVKDVIDADAQGDKMLVSPSCPTAAVNLKDLILYGNTEIRFVDNPVSMPALSQLITQGALTGLNATLIKLIVERFNDSALKHKDIDSTLAQLTSDLTNAEFKDENVAALKAIRAQLQESGALDALVVSAVVKLFAEESEDPINDRINEVACKLDDADLLDKASFAAFIQNANELYAAKITVKIQKQVNTLQEKCLGLMNQIIAKDADLKAAEQDIDKADQWVSDLFGDAAQRTKGKGNFTRAPKIGEAVGELVDVGTKAQEERERLKAELRELFEKFDAVDSEIDQIRDSARAEKIADGFDKVAYNELLEKINPIGVELGIYQDDDVAPPPSPSTGSEAPKASKAPVASNEDDDEGSYGPLNLLWRLGARFAPAKAAKKPALTVEIPKSPRAEPKVLNGAVLVE